MNRTKNPAENLAQNMRVRSRQTINMQQFQRPGRQMQDNGQPQSVTKQAANDTTLMASPRVVSSGTFGCSRELSPQWFKHFYFFFTVKKLWKQNSVSYYCSTSNSIQITKNMQKMLKAQTQNVLNVLCDIKITRLSVLRIQQNTYNNTDHNLTMHSHHSSISNISVAIYNAPVSN